MKKGKGVFNRMTEEDINWIKEVHQKYDSEKRDRLISNKFGVTERMSRYYISMLKLQDRNEDKKNEFILAAKSKTLENKKIYIITSAQNATPIHKDFFSNIQCYAKLLDAGIHVIPYRYKNPTSTFTDLDNDTWSQELMPYLDMNRHNLHKNLQLLSDVKVQPTATDPLTGLQGMTGHQSCIIGHPKQQLRSMPTLETYHDKIMLTTGACTIENYTDSKAGKKGEFHHILGFVIVEIKDNDIFYIRQVAAKDNGDFIDLNNMVTSGKIKKIKKCLGWRLGDIHVRQLDHEKIAENIRCMSSFVPEKIVLDDVFDGETVNPHIKDDHVQRVKLLQNNSNIIEDEVNEMITWLKNFKWHFPNSEIVITKANHDIFLDRYVNSADWKKDYTNAEYTLKLQTIAIDKECTNGIIPYIINQNLPDIRCLGFNESYIIGNTECSQHGHIGSNGSRGTPNQFRNISVKICIGHSHSIFKSDGVVTVGTSTKKRLNYTSGPSSWGQCDVIFDIFNKSQQLIFMEDKKFTTFFD